MCTAEEKFFTPLSASEYRLLDVICTLSQNNEADVSMEELARYAQCSEESIRRALRKLETAELVETVRTKRNLGKFSFSLYKMISPSHKNEGLTTSPSHKFVDQPSHKNVGSTGSSNIEDTSNNQISKTTSYLTGAVAPDGKKKGTIVLVNRWKDEDDSVGGFGLFANEVAEKKVSAKLSKRDPHTRMLRPQYDWTAYDVAAEFDSRLRNLLPVMPQAINTKNIAGALGKYRKDSGSNALIELEVMRMFFEDNWVREDLRSKLGLVTGRFLKAMSVNFEQAVKNLNLPPLQAPHEVSEVSEQVDEFVFASDGKRFDNSMPGRLALAKHEERMRRTVNG
jgi:predicted transcriptional regulator